jgi:hypothetical protein
MILGDSGGGRGIYCHLFALLMRGTEKQPHDLDYGNADTVGCGGIYPTSLKNSSNITYRHKQNDDAPSLNATHYLRWSASGESGGRVFHFDVPLSSGFIRISWAYIYGFLARSGVDTILQIFKHLPYWPDDIVIGTGANDYDHLSRTSHTVTTLDAFSSVGLERETGAKLVVDSVPPNSSTRIWYRNKHCNSRYPALAADEFVSKVFLAAGYSLLETFNFSVGFDDMRHDGFHYDRYPWVLPEYWEKYKPHVGELTAQAAQSMLYNLCMRRPG